MKEKKLISIVIPVFNEEKNTVEMVSRLDEIALKEVEYDFEYIFVNDGSSDSTQAVLEGISVQNPRVKYLEFSRNFGKEIASSAGLCHSSGSATILMDGDLQHPPELIPAFLRKWEKGFEVVVGVRDANEGHSILRKIGSTVYYRIMEWISEYKAYRYSTDFRLIDRKVIEVFKRLPEKQRLTRGLIDWLGFKRDKIIYQAAKRIHGEVRYNYWKLIHLALNSFVSHSLFPLKIAGYLGILITTLSGLFGFFIFVNQFIFKMSDSFYASYIAMLTILVIFLVGIILCCLGLVALYIANIHVEVLNRPLFIIRTTNISLSDKP